MANTIDIFTKMLEDNKAHGCAYCQQWKESTQKCEPIPDCGGMRPVLKHDIPKTNSTTTTTTTIAPITTNNTTKYLLYVALGIIALMIFKKKK
jgi:hypothetical protein